MTVFDGRAVTPEVVAFAEITITSGMLTAGFLTSRALQQIRGSCYGIPPGSHIVVHLGPMARSDAELCKFLASLSCSISFGGAWKAAAGSARKVAELQSSAVH